MARASRRRIRNLGVLTALAVGIAAAAWAGARKEAPVAAGTLKLESPAFRDGERIPAKYTCEGQDLVPPLSWSGAPAGTRSFVLTVFDPDAPRPQGWVHWAIHDLPASAGGIGEGEGLPSGAKAVQNDFGKTAYGGPCPPRGHGVHHYHFTLYALGTEHLDPPADYRALVQKAEQQALASARLTGTYERP